MENLGKYILEAGAIAVAAYLVTGQVYNWKQVATIALSAFAVLFILDLLAPSIAPSARLGAGFGLGFGLTGNTLVPGGLSTIPVEGFAAPVGDMEVAKGIPATYNHECNCSYPCATKCTPEDKCKTNCPPLDGVPPAPKECQPDCCQIGVSGCPYKLVPGQYSERVLLPGYNECVQAYNSDNYVN